MRVLLTGAAGSIGRTVGPALVAAGHDVVGVDLVDASWSGAVAWHVGDCSDAAWTDSVLAAVVPDAVVHLAGHPDELDLLGSFTSHVLTTTVLLDAMVAHGVQRFVYASSNHAVGRTVRTELTDGVLGVDARPRPDTFYGVGKVAAEAVMSLYADRHGIDAVACRIGSFLERPTTRRHLATWLSPGDCVRMVVAALTAEAPGFAVLYGVSANTDGWWDLEPGLALGYSPVDDAAVFADELPARDEDEFEALHPGGPFAGEQYHRRGVPLT
ncbi:NAD-dependent epimerase/dehydratase family protein [Nocardioides yefusunii]|uniref:NAD-dependent epimerase/dehydratase family protein n=1 Tax=Nocardioides yefusunii TaxID=2500546 RepID=A0ABW1R1D1_9ACTN|nr:NAD(P)-dependent oxidoreductase [Nocardioides yefusunii]